MGPISDLSVKTYRGRGAGPKCAVFDVGTAPGPSVKTLCGHGFGPACKELLWAGCLAQVQSMFEGMVSDPSVKTLCGTRRRAHIQRLVVDTVAGPSAKNWCGRGPGSKCGALVWARFRAQV